MSIQRVYTINSKDSFIINNGELQLKIESFDIYNKPYNVLLSIYKLKNNKWVLLNNLELTYDNLDYKEIENFGKIKIINFFIESDLKSIKVTLSLILDHSFLECFYCKKEYKDFVYDFEKPLKIFCSNECLLNLEALNEQNNDTKFLNILIINPELIEQRELLNNNLNLILDKLSQQFLKRKPFLIFNNNPRIEQKNIILKDIEGKDSLSWDLPVESTLFNFLYYLELGYYSFIYPLNYKGNGTINSEFHKYKISPSLHIQTNILEYLNLKVSIKSYYDDSKYIDIKRYGYLNPLGSFLGLKFFSNLLKNILKISISNIDLINLLFNDIKSSIKLIQDIRILFINLLKDNITIINENDYIKITKPDLTNENLLFTQENDINLIDIIINKGIFFNQFEYIKTLLIETWSKIIAKVNSNYFEEKNEEFNLIFNNEFKTNNINNQYFYNSYLNYNKTTLLNDLIFNNYIESLKQSGIFLPSREVLKESKELSKLRNLISLQNIINIWKLTNINRCIFIYNNKDFNHLKELLNNNQYNIVNVSFDCEINYIGFDNEDFIISNQRYDFIKEFDKLIYLYLIFEKIDYFLFHTEFNNDVIDTNEIEIIEDNLQLKFQNYSGLINYFIQLNELNSNNNVFNYIGIYILLLLQSNFPKYKKEFSNNLYEYKFYDYNSTIIEDLKSLIFKNLNIKKDFLKNLNLSRTIGCNFELTIQKNNNEIIQETSIYSFIDLILKDYNSIVKIN